MSNFIFDLQRFAAQVIAAGDTLTLDGVTYTALDGDAVLKYDDDFKVSGLASGKVSAVVTGASDSSTLTIDATDGSTDFTLTSNGEVLTLTKVLPFELDNGAFTLAGNVLTAAKGSDLGIGAGRTYADGSTVFGHDYADTDITYTITDTTLTEETEQETITFTASLGEQSRSITTFVNGKIINGVADGKFTGGFTITKDSAMGLVLGDYTLKATANSDATSQILVDANGANITPGSGDGKLNVALNRNGNEIFAGELECTSGTITFGYDHAVTFKQGTSFNFTWKDYVSTVTATGDATTAIELTDNGITFTPGTDDGGLNLLLSKDGTPIFAGELNVTDGSITFNTDEQKFSFSEGTKISLGIGTDGKQAMDIEIVGGDASFKVEADASGNFTITPDTDDGSLNIAIKQDGETAFQNIVTVNGPMVINPVTNLLTLKDGTNFSLAFNNYTLTATAQGDAASTISLGADGISITPQEGDGKLNLSLGSADGSMSAEIEILSGGFLFGENGALNVVEGTEMQIKFSDDYIINFKATDAAGGALSIGADGITFAPVSEDGGLELSVTRDGETRTASLDVTGSLIYKLDGSISLAKDTVVKNVFEDGNILTITANTDASGSIIFTPDSGLNIKPSTPNALNVAVSNSNGVELVNISSIDGSINYSGGLVTASDGTSAHLLYYHTWESEMRTTGGTASLQFTADSLALTANEGATFVLDYLDGTTLEIQNGSYTDIYPTETGDAVEIVSEGINLRTNDDYPLTLEKAGTYTLNGMNITTTKDNVKVQLTNYDTITFKEGASMNLTTTLSGNDLDITASVTQGEGTVTVDDDGNVTYDATNGTLQITMGLEDLVGESLLPGVFNISGGSVTTSINEADATKNISITKGTALSFTLNGMTVNAVAQNDIDGRLWLREGNILYLHSYEDESPFDTTITFDDKEIFSGTVTLNGAFSYSATGGTVGSVDSSTYNVHDSYIKVALGNYNIKLTTNGDTFFAALSADDNGKMTFDFINENYNSMLLDLSRGDETIFNSDLSITGAVVFDNKNQKIGLEDGASVSLNFKDYTITATAAGDLTNALSLTQDGITITPDSNGSLDITLNNGTDTLTANLQVLSGSLLLGDGGALSLAKDTELQVKFSDDYIVNFKATDAAGGALSIGEDGLTFAPNSDDGGLEISVTRDGQTRTASLDMTGSLTYKLDGSFSLAEGSVIKSVFENGNILTITAKTDASGSMIFTPNNGLDITPSTPNALDILLSRDGRDIIEISGITGSVNYKGDGFTASDGTTIHFVDPAGYYNNNELKTSGGPTTVHFGENGIDYTPGENATFTMDYLQGTTWELQNGTLTDYFAGPIQGNIVLSEGATFDTNDNEFPFALEKAGNYTLNGMKITTTEAYTDALLTGYDTVQFAADASIKVSTIDGGKLFMLNETDDAIQFSTQKSDNIEVSDGTVTFDNATKKVSIAKDTVITLDKDGQALTFTAPEDISATYKLEEDVLYFDLDSDSTAKVSIAGGEQTITGDLNFGGVLSYRPSTGTFGLTGANSSHGDGTNTFAEFVVKGYGIKMATSDTTVVFIPKINDGKLDFNFPNENKHAMAFTVSKDDQTIFENNLVIDGTISLNPTTQELSLTKDTVFTITDGRENSLEITALDDASGKLTLTEEGIRFAPNAGDGALELNFLSTERKASLDITGAVVLGAQGKISLDDGTEINIDWEDGANLKLTSAGSTGSIGFGEKGLKITSDDENLTMKLTMPYGYSTEISGLKGSLWYNAGKAILDEGTKLTGTGTLGSNSVNVTLETIDGDGYLDFSTSDGFVYGAGTGKLKVTYALGEKESTFIVNSGSVLIGNDISKIAEGTDLATDLKDFMPALNFTTEDAGTYTINGQTIKTSAANLALTATDDYMTFTTSNDVVEYDGMTFAGAGKVSLSPDNVVLGAGVEATGFGEGNSFVLAEAGNVTADAKIFELSKIEGTPREIPMIITVTGAQDGFVFSRTLTKESEAYLDDALDDEAFENYTSPYIDKVFIEKFISAGDSSYRIRTDAIGLEEVIGISDGATVTGGAILDNEPTLSYYNLVTNTEGNFTIGERTYNVNGDSSVAIRARFEADAAPYASYFDSLSGTVSGDFTGGRFSINGSSGLQVSGDSAIDIVADENGFEIFGLDDGASLKVSATDTYTVNGTTINANAGDYIVGLGESAAFLSAANNNTLITGTASDDFISNSGASVTINASTGDDTITNSGDNVQFNYAAGDGNDSIVGFNATSTLSISGDYYSTQVSGDDLIVIVGDSKITLTDAASLASTLNIESDTQNPIETLVEMALRRTEAGYPAMAAVAFHPEEKSGDEPTNYSAKEDWSITSTDNLKLHAVCYTPQNSNDKWVVLIHGYGHSHDAMYPYATAYLANGYNVLMIDQRAAGESEGEWLTMGAAESQDVALWTQEIARRNSNAKITLHGVSMGSATAMLAAARADSTNVTALVEDCGYNNVLEVFSIINDAYLKQPSEVVAAMDPVAASLTGYYLHEAAPIASISSATMPSIFITGDADTVVPLSMLNELYDASGAEVKEKFIVEGAGHALAGLSDSVGYDNAVFRFVAEANGEGWTTANTTDEISLRGTKYDDIIINGGASVTITTGAGDDSIINSGDNVQFKYTAGDGDDTIEGFNATSKLLIGGGSYSTAASGDDVIVNVSDDQIVLKGATALDDLNIIAGQAIENLDTDTIITATESDDTVLNYADNVTINLLGGNDLVTNYGESSVIDGGADADVIINTAKNVTINGDDAPDSISNSEGASVSINAGAGNDEIYNSHAYYPTIKGGAGNDSIVVERGHHINIDGGAGNDTILGVIEETITGGWAMGGYATLNGGEGDDFINPISSDSASINGGKGNDTIITGGNDATINGGAGDDIISLQGASVDNNVIEYETGDGNDVIYGLNATGIVSLTTGAEYSTAVSGDDVILTVGENTITVAGASSVNVVNYKIEPLDIENTDDNTLVSGSRLNDTINNEGSNVTVDAGAGKDTVFNFGASASINGGADNDSITNTDALNATINGDYGDDILWNNSDKALIEGSYGNDTVYNNGDNVTVKPGGGHDSIFNDGGASMVIDYSGGNDTIYGFNETSTLQMGGGSYSTMEGLRNVVAFTDDNYIVVLENALLDTDSININGETIALSKDINLGVDDNSVNVSRSNITIDAGAGENLIALTDDATNNNIVFAGKTTVEGFKSGFGNGTDTIYIPGDPAGVVFKEDGLTFLNANASLTLSDVNTTAKVNLYHERRKVLNKGVFIAEDDWYEVSNSDLTVDAGEEVYFVGTSIESKVGVDFSNVTTDLNITMDTEYEIPDNTLWINSVYSLKGGDGLTTITGSDKSDTILAGTGATTINAGAGDDFITAGGAANLIVYNSGDGSDVISNFNSNSTLKIAGDNYTSTKSGDDLIFNVGGDKITLANAASLSSVNVDGTSETQALIESIGADKVSVVSADETSAQNISLSGGELVVVEDTSAKVSITASKGNDTIYSTGENVFISLQGGDTNIFAKEGRMTVAGYNASTSGAGLSTDYEDIFTAVIDGEIIFNKGNLTVGSAVVTDGSGGNKLVNIFDARGELQKVGDAPQDDVLDLSKEKADLIIGTNENSTVMSGAGDDSIFARSGSHVDAGAGKNYIEIEERGASDDGVTIALNEGRNTIAYFKAGFGDDSDKLFFGVNDTLNFKFDGTDVTVKKNNSDCGILSGVDTNAPFVNILAADKNSTEKIVVAQEGATVKVDDEVAALYVGDKSGVDFADYDGALNVNLGSVKAASVGAGDILFGGINQVTLGSGRGNLIGSANRETLTAGTGAATIYGGAGRDLLIGNTSADKDGTTEFIFQAGDGKDTISNFEFLTSENILTADKISVDSAVTNVVLKKSGDVIVQLGDDWITLEDAQGKSFQINDFVAQVDTNITYDDAANYFLATSKNASVTVSEEAEIWLDGSHGKSFVGNIRTLDASNSDGKNTLAGNDLDNVICAGSGDASLWGGNGGDDFLVGGNAHNLFFYTSGNGNDTIQGANDGDAVIFSNVSIDQISGTNITAGGVTIDFKDGGKLNVASTNAVEFAFNDATYLADHSTGTWQQK